MYRVGARLGGLHALAAFGWRCLWRRHERQQRLRGRRLGGGRGHRARERGGDLDGLWQRPGQRDARHVQQFAQLLKAQLHLARATSVPTGTPGGA